MDIDTEMNNNSLVDTTITTKVSLTENSGDGKSKKKHKKHHRHRHESDSKKKKARREEKKQKQNGHSLVADEYLPSSEEEKEEGSDHEKQKEEEEDTVSPLAPMTPPPPKEVPSFIEKKKVSYRKKERRSKSLRSGLVFPVSRVRRQLVKGLYAKRVGAGAPIYLAAVLEYLVADLAEQAGFVSRGEKRKRITSRDIKLAVETDSEFCVLFRGIILPGGGVVPHVHAALLPDKKKRKKKEVEKQQGEE